MQGRFLRIAAGAAAAATTALFAVQALAAETLGQPTDGAIGFQPAATELRQKAMDFHNFLLLPILTGICLLVLGLLLWCIIRYNKRANPTPARFTHNTVVEVVWTAGPVVILLVIAIFSFRLLFDYHDMPAPYMTVKATGYQWYWGYEYPDQKIPEQISALATPEQAAADGVQYKLAATNPIIVPVGKVVRVLVSGADVIHSFSVNAFGIKIDAVPGRVNQTWFKAEKLGTFTGQCSQLCGLDHAFMPIEVKVVSQRDFEAWVASKAPKPAASPAPSSATPAGATTAVAQPAAAAAQIAAKP
jgi:cytochrome c oxidase subunit 2